MQACSAIIEGGAEIMSMSQAEIEQARYNARERDFIAVVGLNTPVEPLQLKSGKWRAYLRNFVTPWSPRGQEAESKEVMRDGYGNIITGTTREELIAKLRAEYPGWRWKT
jgi:hypothetical protein